MIIPTQAMIDFLVGLLETPSPTGYTPEAISYCAEAFSALNLPNCTFRTTPKGALMLHWRGTDASAPRGLTAHTDTLGLMVKEIKASGTLKVTNLGGLIWHSIDSENVTIQTFDKRRYRGTVLLVNPAKHVNPNVDDTKRSADTLEVRLDERVHSEADVRALGIEVGDFIFLDPRVELTPSGFIKSRFLDDKACVATLYGALMALRDSGQTPRQDLHIQIATYEEVGHGGAEGFPPNLAELISLDMGALGHGQNGDEFSVSLCVKDSGGAYHWETISALRHLANQYDIPIKTDIYPYYSSDGTAYWRAGGSARVGLIGPGVASSHGYERTHREALDHTAHLIARYALS